MRHIREILTDAFRQYSERTGRPARTVRQQGEIVELSAATISRIMNGNSPMSRQLATRIGDILFATTNDSRRFVRELMEARNPLDPPKNPRDFFRYCAKPGYTILVEVHAPWPDSYAETGLQVMREFLAAGGNLYFYLPQAVSISPEHELRNLSGDQNRFADVWYKFLNLRKKTQSPRLAFYAARHLGITEELGFVMTSCTPEGEMVSFIWFPNEMNRWEWHRLRRQEHFLLTLLVGQGEDRLPPTNEEMEHVWEKRLRPRGIKESHPVPIIRID